jgi:type II secretory pathway pseudopilin PulG
MGTSQSGFTLLETTIALVLIMVVALGAASLFSFSIYNNSGGSDRAAALAIAQQAMESFRSMDFTPTNTDARLSAGTFVQNGVIAGDGRRFKVTKIIDDNPATVQVDVSAASTLKSIKIIVEPESLGRGWASGAGGTITLLTLRARADAGDDSDINVDDFFDDVEDDVDGVDD